ncbi:hypothetical protein V8E54_009136 [Elaphomyces granulatus]
MLLVKGSRSSLEGIKTPFKKGVQVDSVDRYKLEPKDSWYGRTPLSRTATNGVKLLLENGADLESKDSCDKTPLRRATENEHELVKVLPKMGADPGRIDLKTKDGRTSIVPVAKLLSSLVSQGDFIPATNEVKIKNAPMDREVMQTGLPRYASATRHKSDVSALMHAQDSMDESARNNISGDAQGRDVESEDGTVYSDAASLPAWNEESYISELVNGLSCKFSSEQLDDTTLEQISQTLPELLKAFALKVGHNASTQMHLDVMVFVHKHRKAIAKQFRDKYFHEESVSDAQTSKTDKMHWKDKIDFWLERQDGTQDDTPPQPSINDSNNYLMSKQTEESNMAGLLAYRDFILNSPAYKWLLASLRKETLLAQANPNSMLAIRQDIINSLPTSHRISRKAPPEAYKITFDISWDPLAFFREQSYGEKPEKVVEKVITLTGSARDAQALTCGQYLCQTWPSAGECVIRLVKDVVQGGPDHRHTCYLPDHTKLTAWIHDSKFVIEVFGTGYSVAETGEQFAWLSAALRSSPYTLGVACCTPSIGEIRVGTSLHSSPRTTTTHQIFCKLDFTIQECGECFGPSNGQCWHKMFRNPIIVQGYPIPNRSEPSTGLEIPLEIIAGLFRTRRVNTFNGKLFIKAFSIMLVPTRQSEDLFIWHLLYNKNGSRISYLDNTLAFTGNINGFDLEKARHIVGWCSEAEYYAGAADATYTVETSRLPKPHEGCVLENVYIHAGSIIRGDTRFALGHKDRSVHISRQNDYISKLIWISEKFVVLWDEEDKRGWLINGTSTLLHLLRASLESDIAGRFKSVMLFEPKQIEETSEAHTADFAISVLLNPNNRNLKIYPTRNGYLRLEDRVEHIYDILEKVIDHQVNVTEQHRTGLRKNLEGWDFMHLATRKDLIYPRVATLKAFGKGWVDFTRAIHAITLVGRGFGEIIRPANTNFCSHWAKLPKDRYYLAAGVSDLKKIMDADGDHMANPVKINDSIIWHNLDTTYKLCQCTTKRQKKHSDFVQVLLPSKFVHLIPKKDPVRLEDRGAVIFGHNTDFKWFWKDTGDPEQGESPSVSEEPEMHDSGIGSSLNASAAEGSRDSMGPGSQELSNEGHSGGPFTLEHYTVGIVCALQKELLAVRILFDRTHESPEIHSKDTNHYALGCIGQHNVVAVCLPAGEYGTNSAAHVVAQMEISFPTVQFYLLVGIGGGAPSRQNDVRLGDVVVCQPTGTHTGVFQFDLGKAMEGRKFEPTGSLQRPPRFLMTAISRLVSDPNFSPETLQRYIDDITACKPEYKHPGLQHDKLFKAEYAHVMTHETCEQCNGPIFKRKRRSGNYPRIHYGLIASGNQVIKSAQTRDDLAMKYNILCFEMEAAGVMNSIPCLVIRGICDYADSHKNKLWQEYAAATAAAYAKLLLSVTRNLNDLGRSAAISETNPSKKRTLSSSLQPKKLRRR